MQISNKTRSDKHVYDDPNGTIHYYGKKKYRLQGRSRFYPHVSVAVAISTILYLGLLFGFALNFISLNNEILTSITSIKRVYVYALMAISGIQAILMVTWMVTAGDMRRVRD